MLAKSKIISIILTIIFCVSAITCGIVFGVSKSQPQTGAYNGTETSLSGYIGNLLTSDGKVNETTYNSLISKVGAIGSVSSTKKSSSINSGTPVVFQMGTVGGNPVYWQVTYRTKDYITVWMTRPYTLEYFNNDGKTYASGVFAGTTKTDYDQLGNYSRSTARQATQQIYTSMNSINSVLSQIVASPSAMASATGTSWQATQADTKYSSSNYGHHNGMQSYSGSYYSSWTWDNTVYNDKFWLPSHYEVHYDGVTSYSGHYPGDVDSSGLWGLTLVAKGFSRETFKNSSTKTNYCFLRSGCSIDNDNAMVVFDSGSASNIVVDGLYGVRPAAHLSLASIASFVSRTVTFNSNGGSSCASIKVSPNTAYGTLPTPTKTGYTFAGWYKSSALTGSAVSTSDIVTTDHTLYAKWTPSTYTVTLDPQSGSGGTSSVTATYTQAMPTAIAPTRAGYGFDGYYTGTNGTGTQYYDKDMKSVRNWDIASNTTLYAKWRDCIVTFSTPNNGAEIDNQVTDRNNTMISYQLIFTATNYILTIQLGTSEEIEIKTQMGSITGGDYCTAVRYTVVSTGSEILIEVINQKADITITLGFTNTPQTLKESGASVEGIAVKCTKGGIAYYIADDFESLTDTDTITFATKQVLQGYAFSHWEDLDGNNLGSEMSIRLQKSLVMDNVITAVYVQSTNNSVNNETSNT